MSRITQTSYDAAGRVIGRTVIFVITAPAYYAGQGNWPLGWAGVALAYAFLAMLLVGGVTVAANRARTPRQPGGPIPALGQDRGGGTGSPPLVTPDHKWVSYDGGDHFVAYTAPQPAPAAGPSATTHLADDLERLAELHRSGALSDEEFAAAKHRLLARRVS
jgi:hypothetical protein